MRGSQLPGLFISSFPTRYLVWIGHTCLNTHVFIFGGATVGDGISVVCACVLMAKKTESNDDSFFYKLVALSSSLPVGICTAASPWPH